MAWQEVQKRRLVQAFPCELGGCGLSQRHLENLGQVERAAARGLRDLLSTAEAVRDDKVVRAGPADRRKLDQEESAVSGGINEKYRPQQWTSANV